MKKYYLLIVVSILLVSCFSVAAAQTKNKYSYAAQKNLIPAELGKVYLGMPLKDFAGQIDLGKAEISGIYTDWFRLNVPFEKGNVTGLSVKVFGVGSAEMEKYIREETVTKSDEMGDYELQVKRLDAAKMPEKAIVYSLYIGFKPEFDLKTYVQKKYGKPTDTDGKTESFYIYDAQWIKKSSDELVWLIRYLDFFNKYENKTVKSLQLLGRIKGTEWDPEA